MLDSVNGQPQWFRMTLGNGPGRDMNCGDFMTARPDEIALPDEIPLPKDGAVLDYGCGIGRHLAHIRKRHPKVHCFGIYICDLLLDYCRQNISGPRPFAQADAKLAGRQFDLIMLMGNGLGVLGDEQGATNGLRHLVHSLRPGGRIVLETGLPPMFRNGYGSDHFTIDYKEHRDAPFPWGFADRAWITQALEQLGCHVAIRESCGPGPGDMFFFAVAETPTV